MRGAVPVLVAFAISVLAFVLLPYASPGRFWGFRAAAHFDAWVPAALGAASLAGAALLGWLLRARAWSAALAGSALLAAAFGVLRARTHFLGDGYLNLARLAAAHPAPKFTSVGEDLIHIGFARIVGPLAAYQVLSILAGVVFVGLALWSSRRLFADPAARAIFSLGVASSGPALLFFGHVESYSLFLVATLATSLTALVITTGRVSRLWILPPLALAVFLHVLGVLLVPGVLWVLLQRTGWLRAHRRRSAAARRGTIALLAAVLFVAAGAVVSRSLYARLAIVPIVPGPFTVDGYTLLAPAHLVDFVNLVFLMLPGLLPIAVALSALPLGDRLGSPAGRYLLIALGTTALAAFLIDPKLGMARDWDLYSPFGLHLALLAYWALASRAEAPRARLAASLGIALGVAVLLARAAAVAAPRVAVAQFRDALALDRTKSMNSYQHLVDFWSGLGNEARTMLVRSEWDELYPERRIIRRANHERLKGDLDAAIASSREALALNPILYDAYTNIGVARLARGDTAGAIESLRISDALNPGDFFVRLVLGESHYRAGNLEEAEEWWRRALALDPESYHVHVWMTRLCRETGRPDEAIEHLEVAARHEDADATVLRELADHHARAGRRERAVSLYRRAVSRGLDPAEVERLRARFPEL